MIVTSVFIFLSIISSSYEAFASDFQSPRTAGLGGAGHAAPLLTDAIYLNPSYSSFLQSYVMSVNYGYFHGGDQNADGNYPIHGHMLNGSVQDGRSELFQAGVGLTFKDDSKVLNIGASKAFLQTLGAGLGAKMIFPHTGNGNNAQDLIFSTTFMATNWFQVAGVVDNIRQTSDGLTQGLYREYILGTKANIMDLAFLYYDPHLAPSVKGISTFGQEAGIELTPMVDLFFRGGLFRSSNIPELKNARGNGYALGFGWIAQKLSLDFAVKRTLVPVGDTMTNLGMTVFY